MKLDKKLFGPILGLAVSLAGLTVWAYQFGGGSMDTDATRNRITLRVYNPEAVGFTDGQVLVWKDGSVSDGVEISTTTTANNALVAGVALGAIPATSWGTLLVHGYHGAIKVGTVTAGDSLVTGTTAGQAENYTVLQSTNTNPNDFGVVGVALTNDSGGTCKGFITR